MSISKWINGSLKSFGDQKKYEQYLKDNGLEIPEAKKPANKPAKQPAKEPEPPASKADEVKPEVSRKKTKKKKKVSSGDI